MTAKGKGSCMRLRSTAVNAPLLRGVLCDDKYVAIISALRRIARGLPFALASLAIHIPAAHGQSPGPPPAPLIVTAPMIDFLDENRVSIVSGKAQFSVPAVSLGDVSFVPYSVHGQHFAKGGIADHNYGYIAQCDSLDTSQNIYSGAFECSTANGMGIQPVLGEERASFGYSSSSGYGNLSGDGSAFVDNVNTDSTCTWTKRDGTQVVYVGYHTSGNPYCKSNNVKKIIYPDGRVATYYYNGAFVSNNGAWTPTPIVSIATSSGYLLKYNYSGTPSFGNEVSVTAINRAFDACDPALATACALSNPWPTATLTFQATTTFDNFPQVTRPHYIFTIEQASHRKHVFEIDSYSRVISYQPPEATTPQYTYNLCSNLVGDGLRNCFSWTHWDHLQPWDYPPLLFDQVESAIHNVQTSRYAPSYETASLPYNSKWSRAGGDSRGARAANGNSTPGTESLYGGAIIKMTMLDGTVIDFEASTTNRPQYVTTPAGIKTKYDYDARGNVTATTRNPIPNRGAGVISQSATYPASCTAATMRTCNKPSSVTDGNGQTTEFQYDAVHGGTTYVTSPAVAGGRPEMRYTYAPRQAWYLGSNGAMAPDPTVIWVLATESMCVQGGGCTMVTTYDYGPDSGPNNLMVRGKAVVADGTTLRTCYGHDKQGNKIWETTPNAQPSSCPAY
jgi:YD repeat-containing protein